MSYDVVNYSVERRRSRRIDVALAGTIEFHQDHDISACVINNINEACSGIALSTFDPRVCEMEDLTLDIAMPAGRSSAKCTGRTVWYSENRDFFPGGIIYKAGLSITEISGLDRGKLELVIAFCEAQMQSDQEDRQKGG